MSEDGWSLSGMVLTGKYRIKYTRKVNLSASLLSKEHTRNRPGSTPGISGEIPATKPPFPRSGHSCRSRVFCLGSKRTQTSEKTFKSLHQIFGSHYCNLEKVEKLGNGLHNARYFKFAISVTTHPDRETSEL